MVSLLCPALRLPSRLTKHLPGIHQQSHPSVHQVSGPLAHQQVRPDSQAGCLIMKDRKTSHTLSPTVKDHMYPTYDKTCTSYIVSSACISFVSYFTLFCMAFLKKNKKNIDFNHSTYLGSKMGKKKSTVFSFP